MAVEAVPDSLDDASIDPFLKEFTIKKKAPSRAIVLQSWARMLARRWKYRLWKKRQLQFKHDYFREWQLGYRARYLSATGAHSYS